MPRRALLVFSVALASCGPGGRPGPLDRAPGTRAPLSARCEQLDGTRCLLPWPSNTFTVIDPTTPTGLRLALNPRSTPVHDSPDSLNRADGFSVLTPLAVGFDRRVDHRLDGAPAQGAALLLVAQPGASLGASVPLRLKVVDDSNSAAGLLLAYPLLPLAYDTDYVAVVLDTVRADDGSPLSAAPAVEVALGLQAPNGDAESALAAYHAPTRALLKSAGVDPAHVLRVWDFTTRSSNGVTGALSVMRAAALGAVDAGTVVVSVDSAQPAGDGGSLEVRGRLQHLPDFLVADGGLTLDSRGAPITTGLRDAPFRCLLPGGTGSYPVVVFGHGTGGNVNDNTFDAEILAAGAGKLNFEFYGWTDVTVLHTLLGLDHMFSATEHSTAGLLQALADGTALEAAAGGVLGEALSAPVIAGRANPAAGRRPDPARLVYAGGSLGGTMGLVHSLTTPAIHYGVLNVPGAGWTHFISSSDLWSTMTEVFRSTVPSELDLELALVMTQGNWDPIDGAAWAVLPQSKRTTFLIQESMGDPVLPNIGDAMVAESTRAVQVGVVLEPLEGLTSAMQVSDQTGVTQYRVPATETSDLSIHGFAAHDTKAGIAAREQIAAFLLSVWAGAPQITVPPTCLANPGGSCDFSH